MYFDTLWSTSPGILNYSHSVTTRPYYSVERYRCSTIDLTTNITPVSNSVSIESGERFCLSLKPSFSHKYVTVNYSYIKDRYGTLMSVI